MFSMVVFQLHPRFENWRTELVLMRLSCCFLAIFSEKSKYPSNQKFDSVFGHNLAVRRLFDTVALRQSEFFRLVYEI